MAEKCLNMENWARPSPRLMCLCEWMWYSELYIPSNYITHSPVEHTFVHNYAHWPFRVSNHFYSAFFLSHWNFILYENEPGQFRANTNRLGVEQVHSFHVSPASAAAAKRPNKYVYFSIRTKQKHSFDPKRFDQWIQHPPIFSNHFKIESRTQLLVGK